MSLKIISWNVNGIRAIHKKGFIDWLKKENPDIMCLQETKAWPEQLPEELINLSPYYSFFSSAEKKGYSGVGVYSKIAPVSVEHGLGIEKFDSEGRTLLIDFQDFVLFNIYYPNGKASEARLEYKLGFYEAFLSKAMEFKKAGRNIVICGDLNTAHKEIDLARPKENSNTSGFLPTERSWIDKFLNTGFIDVFREFCKSPDQYTWWDYATRARERNVGWRIDYFFVDNKTQKLVSDAFILPNVKGSDHCPVGVVINT